MTYVKAEDITTNKLLEIKNNSLSFPEPKYIQTFDVFGNLENNPEEFHKHYQCLALTREEQEQWLEHQALEAVQSQKRPDRREHPIAYASQSLSPAKKNYRTPALEHLAIYWAVIK
ncbi:hypothetical protein G9A89_015808 [Geosiphon pyriformis]|nr:hypothetical protein G9A89_015808 [Geosiphon pyriformis]